jgi:hypothetical protein
MKDDLNSTAAVTELAESIHSSQPEVLANVASDPHLTEELALALLDRRELPTEVVERLSKNPNPMNSRKVRLAVVRHPKTPRHITLPLLRQLFTFDLMKVAFAPAVQSDIKVAAEDCLIHRLETLTTGERLSLAHRASSRVAGALLLDAEPRVIHAALENPRLTETMLIRQLNRHDCSTTLVEFVCRYLKWSVRVDVRLELLQSEKTPLASALEIVCALPPERVREILDSAHIPANVRSYVAEMLSTKP